MTFKFGKEIKVYFKDFNVESLNFAVSDLLSDLASLFGKSMFAENDKDADIVVKIDNSLEHEEEYKYEILNNKVILSGKGDLGAMWAIYSFLEKELKVPPFYKIEGLHLSEVKELTLDNKVVNEYPKTKFRGWFINDEDLLTDFKYEGHRDIDYEYYRNVIAKDMMNMLAETALRFRMNLIIPSTLIDITSPYEDGLLEVCSKRGLYLSQHHIEPLGVSKFGFAKFVKENGYNDGFSYISNKEALTKCWEYYVKKWSKYPRVVWQLGLRGGTDRPVWATDKSVGSSNEERGALISGAMVTQCSIVKNNYPHELYFSSTLWMEGAELLKTGNIVLPNDVIICFSDIGMSQLFGNDFFDVKRLNNVNYGTYYHSAYWHTGPHLAEGVRPEKMVYCYDLLRKYHSEYYSVMNVANIKELTFSIYLNSHILWQDKLDLDEIYENYTKLYLDDNKLLIKAIKDYYNALGDVGEVEYDKFCHKYNFDYRKYDDISFPVVSLNDGMLRSSVYSPMKEKRLLVTKEIKEVLENGLEKMPKAYEEFNEVLNKLQDSYKVGFRSHWVFESDYFINFMKFGKEYYQGVDALNKDDKVGFKDHYQTSKQYLYNIIEMRDKYLVDEYKGWQAKEGKIGIAGLLRILDEEVDLNGGE